MKKKNNKKIMNIENIINNLKTNEEWRVYAIVVVVMVTLLFFAMMKQPVTKNDIVNCNEGKYSSPNKQITRMLEENYGTKIKYIRLEKEEHYNYYGDDSSYCKITTVYKNPIDIMGTKIYNSKTTRNINSLYNTIEYVDFYSIVNI